MFVKTIDFRGFRFGKIHTSDLHLEIVSTSDRYEARILPNPTDNTSEIPGSDGQYYFGQTYKNREITCSIAFDEVSERDYRKIRQVFSTDKLQDLVFDEEPYKTWKAKLKSKPEFKSLCFTNKDTGERVYKGEGKLSFICYYPYAFGFDKYIVRAADYYMLKTPECIITEQEDEGFIKAEKNAVKSETLPEDLRYQYNVNPSDYLPDKTIMNPDMKLRDKAHQNKQDRPYDTNNDIWKTGFPTYSQVAAGELYFDTPQGEKTIIDVRGYWDNIPEWQNTAQLLTTPTLDFDQQLIYLPQYSKTDFINMETGFNSHRPLIGSRLLVYNPGDLPVEWELKFNENKRAFWSCRGGTKFRISRFNVDRLEIGNAVDWCGLKTYKDEDNDYFKYGRKYFMRRGFNTQALIDYIKDEANPLPEIYCAYEDNAGSTPRIYTREELISKILNGTIPFDKHWSDTINLPYSNIKDNRIVAINGNYDAARTAFNTHLDIWKKILGDDYATAIGLGEAHPEYCYYVEPIPKERLGHFIKLFYWQTIQWRGEILPHGGWAATDRYKEMLKDCLDENGSIIDVNNPLIQMAKMFATLITDKDTGKTTLNTRSSNKYRDIYKKLDFEEGIAFANRYEELYNECIYEEEKHELYWKTLRELLYKFYPIIELTCKQKTDSNTDPQELIETFIDSYINHPSEYIGTDLRDLNYGEEVFNGYHLPSWYTQDYMEIDQSGLSGVETIKAFLEALEEDPESVFYGNRRRYTESDKLALIEKGNYSSLISTLDKTIGVNGYLNDLLDDKYYLNTDERILFTTANPYGAEFVYKPSKVIMNDAIHKGNWFKLPPGWSLICIEPVVDEALWGGKRWKDARPYDWGYGGDLNRNKREVQQLYDYVYSLALNEFFEVYPMEKIRNSIIPQSNLSSSTTEDKDELTRFKMWYEDKNAFYKTYDDGSNYFAISLYSKLRNDGEYQLLKIINSIWNIISPYFKWSAGNGVFIDPDSTANVISLNDYDVAGFPLRCINGDISDWWWYACNYLWANFPPLYWAMADMLNDIKIKYIPLFY